MMRIPGLMVLSVFLAASCASGPESPSLPAEALDPALVSTGRDVAVIRCSQCHALDGISHSPNPSAPPMAKLLERYDADMLASDLIEGIRVGHDEMPDFDLQVIEADALVAYLKSLR
jgi:mono/diheme cytochrome c family protein